MKHLLQKLFLTALCITLLINGFTQTLPRTVPGTVGFSSERLQRIDAAMQSHINNGTIPGSVVLVAKKGKIAYQKAYGMKDLEAKTPMTEDAIFRIASMTKVVTTVAALMLMEEGKFLLDDPISHYIPAFESPKVLVENPHSETDYSLEDAKSPIRVRHLLSHTSGITYGLFGKPQLSAIYREAGISDGITQTEGTWAEMVEKLAKLPLSNHPGEAFEYGLNTDVLGRLVEIWSGMPLDRFFQERIFKPLQMKDTHFFLPENKLNRLVTMYEPNPKGGLLRLPETQQQRGAALFSSSFHYQGPRTFLSGGGGLVSTAIDYARFAQMLLNGGKLDGLQLLSEKTIELMMTNQIGELSYPWVRGHRFGFGGYVSQGPLFSGEIDSAGTFGWSGYFSTYFFIDPKEDIVAILMTQVIPELPRVEQQFKNLVYQALVD